MSNSLQDQLMKAGLIDKKKAKEISKEKNKGKQKIPKGQTVVDESKLALQQTLKAKVERDRELNRQKNAQLQQKAIQAQIKQLIQSHKIDMHKAETAYQFTDGKHIKKIFVNNLVQNQLIKDVVAIARQDNGYSVVPRVIAEKIAIRDPAFVVVLNKNTTEDTQEDDPYADYQIPDDLMW